MDLAKDKAAIENRFRFLGMDQKEIEAILKKEAEDAVNFEGQKRIRGARGASSAEELSRNLLVETPEIVQ